MTKHKLEEQYTDKKGKLWNYRCKVCYRTWVNKPKGDCAGKPFQNVKDNAPTDEPKKKRKQKERTASKSAKVHVIGGEIARIDRKYANDPLNRQRIRRAYLKNLRMEAK